MSLAILSTETEHEKYIAVNNIIIFSYLACHAHKALYLEICLSAFDLGVHICAKVSLIICLMKMLI